MRDLLLFWMILVSCATVNAQAQVGVKGGLNLADLRGDFANGYHSRTGFNAGIFIELPITRNFSIKPEVVYSLQGADLSAANFMDGNLNLHYINVPVLAKYNFLKGLFVETGPQIGFLTSAKFNERSSGLTNLDPDREKTDFSWAFGVGYEFGMGLGLNGRYNVGINTTVPTKNVDQKNSVVQIGVFYKFRRR